MRAAIIDAVDREDFGYVEADLGALTASCAAFLETQYGWEVPAARIFPVADVLSAISTALDVFVEPGSGVVVPTPAYPPFFEVVELTGRPVVEAPMIRATDRDTLDLDAIDAALAAAHARCCCAVRTIQPAGCSRPKSWPRSRRSSTVTAHASWPTRCTRRSCTPASIMFLTQQCRMLPRRTR